MKITTKTRYGLRALIYIAINTSLDTNNLVRIKDISQDQKITTQYLEQILHKLKEAQIIEGKRGPNGGYKIFKDPKEIKIGDVFEILESDIRIAICEPDSSVCVGQNCTTLYIWNKLNQAVENVLNNTTLQEMIDEHKQKVAIMESGKNV